MQVIKTVNYKDQQLPLAFNMASFLKFCKLTGIKSISQAQEKVLAASSNLDDAENFELTATMYYCGIVEGHRLQGKLCPYTKEDFMELEMINAIGQAFMEDAVPEYTTTAEETEANETKSPNV